MKIQHILMVAACMLTHPAVNSSETSEFNKRLIARKLPQGAIQKIIIKERSAKSFSKESYCQELVIDEKRILFFLRHAKPDNEYNYSQEGLTGDCSAEGLVVFKDGRKVQVAIDNATGSGVAMNYRTTYYMRCEACEGILQPDFSFDPHKRSDWR
ncbi:hypothetical protein WKI45_16150 [Delftia tsuruhatensis]